MTGIFSFGGEGGSTRRMLEGLMLLVVIVPVYEVMWQ